MDNCVILKTKDLRDAWENACDDGRSVLERLYPTELPPVPRGILWEDVTGEIEFVHVENRFFVIVHDGVEIARQRRRGTSDSSTMTMSFYLKNDALGKYMFKPYDNGNWQLLRVKT